MQIWLNGSFGEDLHAALPATAAGQLLGWGVYSTMGIRAGKPIALNRHLARLRHAAAKLEIKCAFDDTVLQAALHEIITRNEVTTGIARLTLTQRGDGRWNTQGGSDFLIVAHTAAPAKLDDWQVMLSPFRMDARRPTAGVKSTSHMDFHLAWQQAKDEGFEEAIICNQLGAVCEGTRANLFWARDGTLFTPSLESGCLPGIAREIVLEIAEQKRITVHQGLFSIQELSVADEIFLTAATTGPRSVGQFHEDGFDNGYPSPGELTAQFQIWWSKFAEETG